MLKIVGNVREKVYNLGVVVEKRIILHKLGESKMENTMLINSEEDLSELGVEGFDGSGKVEANTLCGSGRIEAGSLCKNGKIIESTPGENCGIETNAFCENGRDGTRERGQSSTHEVSRELKIERRIVDILLNIGITANLHGYIFLKEAIKLALETPAFMCSISKNIYPKVASKYSANISQIERSIRGAIEVSYNKDKITHLNDIFDLPAFGKYEQPTTSEFLALIANRLALEFY